MPWWAWMLLGMAFATRWFGWRRHGWRRTPYWMRGGWAHRGPRGVMIVGGPGCGRSQRYGIHARPDRIGQAEAMQPPVELLPQQKQERAMAELRRRYVADDITVEEYERELDRLIREK
jgi:hypothetical protein